MTPVCEHCGEPLRGKRAHARYCDSSCRADATRLRQELEGDTKALKSAQVHPLADARAQQEEGDTSADYLILAREQIARTLLHTGWFTADDLEPLGIPQQYRRSVHGSATGYFSGEEPYMEEAGRRKSERPERKGAKNTVFRITAKGRRELPKLLKDMAGPVRDASKRLYGDRLVGKGGGFAATGSPPSGAATGHSPLSGERSTAGVGTENREGPARSSAALDRPNSSHCMSESPNGARSSLGADPGEGSSGAVTGHLGEPRPTSEPVPLFEEEQRALHPLRDREAA